MPEKHPTLSQVEEIREQAVAAQYCVDKLADSTVLEALDSVPALCELVKVMTEKLTEDHNNTDLGYCRCGKWKCPTSALLRQLKGETL